MRPIWTGLAAVVAIGLFSACALPFGLGEPASRALEQGAQDSLSKTKSFEISGFYSEGGSGWTIDVQVQHPDGEHVMISGGAKGNSDQLEAIIVAGHGYFRGQQFLAQHLGGDPVSKNLALAAGNAWWKGSSDLVPRMPELTDGTAFRTTFLGSAASKRTDHVAVDGYDAVELSGQRADVYIAAAPPHRLLRLHLVNGVVIDGVGLADFHYSNYDKDFGIAAPSGVIDFSNLSTLPPVYTVVSVDTSACGSPCVVSAQLKNLGGMSGAKAPSTVTFALKDAGSGQALGSCTATVSPDVGYNGTTTVSCTISNTSGQQNAAIVTATADNPGHA